MTEYTLTLPAQEDLEEIARYLRNLPERPARRIAEELQDMLREIARRPKQGKLHSTFSMRIGEDVRVRITGDYIVYYVDRSVPEIIAILHGRRDLKRLIGERIE